MINKKSESYLIGVTAIGVTTVTQVQNNYDQRISENGSLISLNK
jgi:hypothetical protein